MIELVFAVCMVDQPLRCKTVNIPLDSETRSVRSCTMKAQHPMAQWIGEHPNWVVKNWHCRPVGEVAKA